MKPNTIQRGFTLVEMAIVLAIIGLILGAVMIGKDVQRNAEYTKIKQKFIDQWVVAYNAAYQRTGSPIKDSQTKPQLMVNGSAYSGTSGGDMTNATEPPAVCAVGAAPGLSGAAIDLRDQMLRLGVRMPPGRAEGSEDRYVYLDSNGNPQEIQVCFKWNKPGTASGAGNVMVITGLTPDLARSLDQMVDGKPDAQEGMFRMAGVANGTGNAPGVEWAGNNTFAHGATGGGDGVGQTRDEDQVMVLTAHYKMNQ
jgi:prepilin-type N-terminal cleavage/methylation domain-containing protein